MGRVPDLVVFAVVMSILIINIVKLTAVCKNNAEKKHQLAQIKGIVWLLMICSVLFFLTESLFMIIQPQLYDRTLTCFTGVVVISLSSRISARINADKEI